MFLLQVGAIAKTAEYYNTVGKGETATVSSELTRLRGMQTKEINSDKPDISKLRQLNTAITKLNSLQNRLGKDFLVEPFEFKKEAEKTDGFTKAPKTGDSEKSAPPKNAEKKTPPKPISEMSPDEQAELMRLYLEAGKEMKNIDADSKLSPDIKNDLRTIRDELFLKGDVSNNADKVFKLIENDKRTAEESKKLDNLLEEVTKNNPKLGNALKSLRDNVDKLNDKSVLNDLIIEVANENQSDFLDEFNRGGR